MVTSSAVLQSAPPDSEQLARRVAELEAKLAQVTAERDKLRRAYEQLKEQLELLRRRIYVARAERIDTAQLEIEFAETKAKLDALARAIDDATPATTETDAAGDPTAPPPRSKPTGRRNLGAHDLPEERVEIFDPAFAGQEPIGFEESFKLKYRRGGPVRVVVARAIYKPAAASDPEAQAAQPVLVTTPMPRELFPRGLLAPSMIAHLLVQKYRWGLPFHRQARMLAADGFGLDDGTMCRYAEDAGATLGCIVEAMAKEAKATAFCLSTDATGVCIQPEPLAGRQRQACRKGHFFVVMADADHVFFEFQPRHTSAAVCAMFRGFSGYIQADAHVIYDAVFRGDARASPNDKAPWRWAAGLTVGEKRGKLRSSRRTRRHAKRCCASASSSTSRPSGGTFRRRNDTTGGSSSRAGSSTTSSPGPRSSTRASRAPAAWSPPPSATPCGKRPPCAAFSTMVGCP